MFDMYIEFYTRFNYKIIFVYNTLSKYINSPPVKRVSIYLIWLLRMQWRLYSYCQLSTVYLWLMWKYMQRHGVVLVYVHIVFIRANNCNKAGV